MTMKRFRIAILSIALLSMLLAGCASTKSATTDPDEGSGVRSKEVGSQENTDISSDGDTGVE